MNSRIFSFPKTYRLLTAEDYKHAFTKAVKIKGQGFNVYLSENNKHHSRLGLIVARKVDKRAVVRNRIKRIIRESFRQQQLCGFNIVVIALPGAAKLSKKTLRGRLDKIWRELQTTCDCP